MLMASLGENTTNIGNDASPGMAGLTDIFMGDGNPKITKLRLAVHPLALSQKTQV